ncbi:MAG: hypothetical protein B7X90_01675 [Novosphingobium sp. 17-62-19]|uniref:hypothetical protein n=1 Tax=Novosphingobium sp. 17-62-19 TaxID=1970406 RepID=UPI000BD98F4E|nr:hypothetical protein [Novosphingobium sp. 17-62-19]OZA21503.1 MAG: hypothetical protein B7X90_01675 [Novosphingobium sp. 17-62-19]HQS96028.1 hypothetical protein [Novosphingobium sp.]
MAMTASAGTTTAGTDPETIEGLLRQDLFHADQAMLHMGPILRHLLQNDDRSIFSDEIIARVRGMLADVARQLVQAMGEAAGHADAAAWAREAGPGLAEMLAARQPLLYHLHMLAVEWQLTEKLHGSLGIDPVLTPLLQDVIASADPDLAARGMNLLAAQARFGQQVRRMQIPLAELPTSLHEIALATMQTYVGEDAAGKAAAEMSEITLRQRRAVAASRLDLLNHIISVLGPDRSAMLKLDHAGAALFLSGLAANAGLARETAIMCTTESQMPRLALSLVAANVRREGVVATFSALHPDIAVPAGIKLLDPARATALLADTPMDMQA